MRAAWSELPEAAGSDKVTLVLAFNAASALLARVKLTLLAPPT